MWPTRVDEPLHELGTKGGETSPWKHPLPAGFQGGQWNLLDETDHLIHTVFSGSFDA